MLMLGDRLAVERLVVKIMVQYECTIIIDLVPVESEERLLGLEVTDLQDAIDLCVQAGPATGECQFGLRQCKVFQPLCIVEVRQALQRFVLGIGQDI
jgi:hypothetical protein